VCFADHAVSTKRHLFNDHVVGCQITVASFRLANSVDDVFILTPTLAMVDPALKRVAARDAGVHILAMGPGPYPVFGGAALPLRGPEGHFTGNCLRHVWYATALRGDASGYENVMIADGSDVFFQRDPFELSAKLGPAVDLIFFGDRADDFKEGERYFRLRMNQCADKTLTAPDHLDRINSDFRGIYANGGLLLGKAQAMLSLSTSVEKLAVACAFWESDQGLVNFARHLEMKTRSPGAVVAFADKTHSVSMGHYAWPTRDSSGQLLSLETREPLYIVHQYYSGQHHKDLGLYFAKVKPWLHEAAKPVAR